MLRNVHTPLARGHNQGVRHRCALGYQVAQGIRKRAARSGLFRTKKATFGPATHADHGTWGMVRGNGGLLDSGQGAVQSLSGLLGFLAPDYQGQIRSVPGGHARSRSVGRIISHTIQGRNAEELRLLGSPMRADPMHRARFEQ